MSEIRRLRYSYTGPRRSEGREQEVNVKKSEDLITKTPFDSVPFDLAPFENLRV